MRKLTLFVLMFVVIILKSQAQTVDSTISIVGKKIYQNGIELKNAELKSVLINNSASSEQYKKYKTYSAVGIATALPGTVLLLVGAGVNLAGAVKEANDVANGNLSSSYPNGIGLIATGLALDIISIPFMLAANKNFKGSIRSYNSSFGQAGNSPINIDLSVNGNGLSLIIHF